MGRTEGGRRRADTRQVRRDERRCCYSYELSVQFDNATPDRGRYGLYAAWQDADNYVRVTIDAARRSLITEHCVKGRTTTSETPLSHTSVHYPDIKYTDSFEKQYRFDSDTYVSSILLPSSTPTTIRTREASLLTSTHRENSATTWLR